MGIEDFKSALASCADTALPEIHLRSIANCAPVR
jgi:hypothetical protein